MSQTITLEVVGLRLPVDAPAPRARLSGRGLLAAKALAAVALVAATLSWRLVPPALPRSTVARSAGVEMRWPAAWMLIGKTSWGVYVRQGQLPSDQPASEAFLMRLSFGDFADFHCLWPGRSLAPGWRDNEAAVLSAVATFFHMDEIEQPLFVESARVGDRPAVMMVSRRRGDWAALAIAPGEDIVAAGLCAPTAKYLRRAWRQWTAMLAAARLLEPVGGAAEGCVD